MEDNGQTFFEGGEREATEQEKQDYINALKLEAEIIKSQLKREDEDYYE